MSDPDLLMPARKCFCCKEIDLYAPKWVCWECMRSLGHMKDEIWSVADMPIDHPDKQAVIQRAKRFIVTRARTAEAAKKAAAGARAAARKRVA
jgi:hypothetical protein